MLLQFRKPDCAAAALETAGVPADKTEYFVPYDIDAAGNYCSDGYVAVTRENVYVIQNESVISKIMISELQDVRCEGLVDNGILVFVINGAESVGVRFSMHHISRYAYIARGIRLFIKGDFHLVTSMEPENICQKCGHIMPGTGTCPRCEGKKTRLKRLGKLCKPYVGRLSVIWLLMLAASGISLYQQQWQRQFIDNVLVPESGTAAQIIVFFAVMVALIGSTLGINILKRYLGVLLGAKMSMDLRTALFDKIQKLSLSYQDSRKPGDLMNRVTNDTTQVRSFMENTFTNMFTYIITFIGALIIMLIMNWWLTLLSMVFIPVMWLMVRLFRKKMHRLFRRQRRREDKLNSRLQDVIQGIKVVKCFGKEKFEADSFSEIVDENAKIQEYNECFWAKFQPVIGFVINLGSLMVLFLGGRELLTGTGISVGQMVQFIGYSNMLFGPLRWFTMLPRMIMNMNVSLSRIDDVMAQEPEIKEAQKPLEREISGNVEFKNVTFGYRNYEPVLNGISFSAKPGEMIGFVGESGAGKSTIINLIMRLYDVDDGCILVDGEDIRNYSERSLHSQIGVVLQENYLFSGTIYDNIRFSRPDATPQEVIKAAKTAGAHDFICRFPDGYNTYVGEKGQRLSGGERQRIAIARALLNDPKILILDEATSSLDTESEFLIQRALDNLTKGRTTFAIAHRLSTLKNADRLMVINNHGIAESGTHNELVEKGGIYAGLVDAQLKMHAVRND